MRESQGDRFIMGHANPVASQTLQRGVWAAFQYFNMQDLKFHFYQIQDQSIQANNY